MKDLIRMNQLAGIITEGQARKMMAILNEAEDFKVGETYTASMPTDSTGKNRMDVKEEQTWDYNEDLDNGGYVEAMGPELDSHIDEILRIFKEWKSGPMTEPEMEGYAKDDLVDYIQMKIRNA